MSDAITFLLSREEIRKRYRVELLAEARLAEAGICHRREGEEQVLAWASVRRVLGAEVGEPQGVRTVIFDLVVEASEAGFDVVRFDAEPGEEASETARNLLARLPSECLTASLKSLAADGLAGEWHPDVESFEEAALAALASLEL